MVDKTIDLAAAVDYVQDGHTLAIGGMTLYRRPMAFVRALLKRSKPPVNLSLVALTASLEADMLVGAGLVTQTQTCYFGLESFGLAPMFTAAANAGQIIIKEESEASMASGLRAALAGVGFMPSRAWLGTEMFAARPDIKTITDPYTGQTVTAFPAIRADVAVIHVLKADRSGNCVLGGNPTIDGDLASICQHVIITAEELVDRLQEPIDLISQQVSAVVHCPQGAWPTSCYPKYALDGEEILRYIDACNQGDFDQYLASLVV